MSRALDDFRFKRNTSLPPEDQIITANPDIISHQITKEDEFFILATDGSSYMSNFCHSGLDVKSSASDQVYGIV